MSGSENIAIIILAAGASKRMGQSKQLLKWGEFTLLEHAIKQACETLCEQVIVVLGAHSKHIKSNTNSFSATLIENPNWENGMSSSISCGIKHLKALKKDIDGVLITLADQPFISTSDLNALIKGFKTETALEKQIVATQYMNHLGVPALFGKYHFKALEQIKHKSGAKQIIQDHLKTVYSIPLKGSIQDIDNLEDYKSALKKKDLAAGRQGIETRD